MQSRTEIWTEVTLYVSLLPKRPYDEILAACRRGFGGRRVKRCDTALGAGDTVLNYLPVNDLCVKYAMEAHKDRLRNAMYPCLLLVAPL